MNDFEKRLSDALKNSTEGYRPSDPYVAKERFLHRLRRRRFFYAAGGIALAGAAVIAAFTVVPGLFAPSEGLEPLPSAQEIEEVGEPVSEIAVGERPKGVAYGDGHVWVVNEGSATVDVIDPVSREVVDSVPVSGEPDDIAVGVGGAWVSDASTGIVTSLPLHTAEIKNPPVEIQIGEGGSAEMDVSPGVDGLWVSKDEALFRVDPMSLASEEIPTDIDSPTDVAVGEGSVYVLGVSQVGRVDPLTGDTTVIADVQSSDNQDMAFRDGYLWIANGDTGEVTRLDPNTGISSDPIFVGGSYSGIAVDESGVWVISGNTSDTGVLTRIDPETVEIVEPRVELDGRPFDVTVGAGRVWVANLSAGSVTTVSTGF